MIGRATAVAAALMAAAWAPTAATASSTNKTETGSTSDILESVAAPYVYLRSDVASIEASPVTTAARMREIHHLLASHDPEAMATSFVAYAALVAADTPAFAEGIEKALGRRQRNRDDFLRQLATDPMSVQNMQGGNEAIAAIMMMSAADATRIGALGNRFIDNAYSMQGQAWARGRLKTDGMSRVRGASEYAQQRTWPITGSTSAIMSKGGTYRPNLVADELWTMAWSPEMEPPNPNSSAGAMLTRALILAARYATDSLTEADIDAYAKSRPTQRCFVSAKLNFDQCIAATRTPYEEAFCIGTHGLNDVSRCVGWPAGAGATQ